MAGRVNQQRPYAMRKSPAVSILSSLQPFPSTKLKTFFNVCEFEFELVS